jgi:lipid-A-disaccharide synthase
LLDAVARLDRKGAAGFVLALPAGFWHDGGAILRQRVGSLPVKVVEGQTWDAIAHSEVALAASGTVTIEAALLATPMVTFYRVSGLSWLLGKSLVDVPFYSMVNLVAGRRVVPELIQNEMRAERLAAETLRLLGDAAARERMRQDLSEVAARLAGASDPMERAAKIVAQLLRMDRGVTHVA